MTAKEFRELRKLLQLTQEELATRLDVSRTLIVKSEKTQPNSLLTYAVLGLVLKVENERLEFLVARRIQEVKALRAGLRGEHSRLADKVLDLQTRIAELERTLEVMTTLLRPVAVPPRSLELL